MKEIYSKLVDLYADQELPQELTDELEAAAEVDLALRHDLDSLKKTVEALHDLPPPEMTSESFQRILFSLYANGVDLRGEKSVSPSQLRLPLSG